MLTPINTAMINS